jgi:hypothetical protein
MLKTWEKYGFIWVAHADVPDSAFPDFTRRGFQFVGGFTEPFRAPLPVVLDNFGEVEHSFQVHVFVGTSSKSPDTLSFASETREDETIGRSSSKYRGFPLKLHRLVGIGDRDNYHIDWVFRFKPLHGSYHNYLSDPVSATRRPVSYIVTVFLVPVRDRERCGHRALCPRIERWPTVELDAPGQAIVCEPPHDGSHLSGSAGGQRGSTNPRKLTKNCPLRRQRSSARANGDDLLADRSG